ncbi:MAG: transcription termination/antitermination protein NusG [Candidatus Binatia bacterium]
MEKQWYAIRTHVGSEKRVRAALQRKIVESGQEAAFGEIVVPTEKVIDVVRGTKKEVERYLFPGYVLVHMLLNEHTWHVVHSVPKVVGFIGESDTAPTPVPAAEVERIQQQIATGHAAPRPRQIFTVGEQVKIVDGPFRDFNGVVEDVRPERARVRVAVSVFGRATPVELDFLQVEAA